jgi:hypothetical protein
MTANEESDGELSACGPDPRDELRGALLALALFKREELTSNLGPQLTKSMGFQKISAVCRPIRANPVGD